MRSLAVEEIEPIRKSSEVSDYAQILRAHGTEPVLSDAYFAIGKPEHPSGWILHLSVICLQFSQLLKTILPTLAETGVPFKVPVSEDIGKLIIDGYLGHEQVGKMVTIFPSSDQEAASLAAALVSLTREFRGPKIPTDAYLGGAVYTRFGAHIPIIKPQADGNLPKRYYEGEKDALIPDDYIIPFKLPRGREWPFTRFGAPQGMRPKKILSHKCNIISVLKADARGEVIKGIYLKSLLRLQLKQCVIKEGRMNMTADKYGRDMRDRLAWQLRLHKELESIIPLPKIFDFFEDEGDSYLVMEFVKGLSLFEVSEMIRGTIKGWLDLLNPEKLLLLSHLQNILSIIQKMHESGYVHRDITPVNFLINEKGCIIPIDIELAYSLNDDCPLPPFAYGTAGFISPEQAKQARPTTKEDLYGIGASLLQTITGLHPLKFVNTVLDELEEKVNFFVQHPPIARAIALSLSPDPGDRPTIQSIQDTLRDYMDSLLGQGTVAPAPVNGRLDSSRQYDFTIEHAIRSLVELPTALIQELWASKVSNAQEVIVNERKVYTVTPGLSDGVAGVLYVLARCAAQGLDIEPCKDAYARGWQYVSHQLNRQNDHLQGELYRGTGGVAVALAEAVRARLVDRAAGESVIVNLLTRPVSGMNLFSGLSGQGLAILHCRDLLGQSRAKELLEPIVRDFMASQDKNGGWLNGGPKDPAYFGLSFGFGGIIWFLFQYYRFYPNQVVRACAERGIARIATVTNGLASIFKPNRQDIGPPEFGGLEAGALGAIALFINAYETTQDNSVRKMAEDALRLYPPFITNNNLGQAIGLSGLGEVYLNAYCAFGDPMWLDRASWIAESFCKTRTRSASGGFYWNQNEGSTITADFMTGSAGIIHFLLRMARPSAIGYRVLT